VLLGWFEDGEFHVTEPLVVVAYQRESAFDVLLHRRLRKPLGAAGAVGVVGDLLANLREVLLTRGRLDVRQECRPCTHERHPSSAQVAGGAHGGGVHVGLGQQAAAQQHRHLMGIDRVVFRLAPMDRFHIQGMSKDQRKAFTAAEGGEPVPGEDPFNAHDQIFPVGRNGLEKRVWPGRHMPVDANLASLVHDAYVQGARMPIDAPVKARWLGVETPEVSSAS
jgi:hypothetical protein